MPNIDLIYINLDRAVERREALERNFREANFSSAWKLHRFPAVLWSSDAVTNMAGPASPTLKGNWLSHIGCMRRAIESGWKSHLLIAEDDAEFSPKAEAMVNLAINDMEPDSWDILFLDLLIPRAIDMPSIFSLRQHCALKNETMMLNLEALRHRYGFIGAGAYVVNNASLHKMFTTFNSNSIPAAYDVALRHFIYNGDVKAFAIFPFPATVNVHGDNPDVSHPDNWVYECSLMHEFRRLIWIDSDLDLRRPELARDEIAPDVERFQSIFARLLSRQYAFI
ncbi:glycosyltransferase family 25 protein [Niveispirillum sp. KHB5.9]|uniref:glycosyltransferase family 25 protein n=1 Tax=Niveispirillum sp. KHB5.9 TaxID=3400269 RepID=UPI003A83D35B